ncbi:Scr1 family TA system antitoxin-like transcriptional regulator [Nocardiopsis sp. NPDC058789]|uniref:Scr1 family TA system antitoxin-like transcriptional regulator n=1 Tax=Nocardiopsis sp. NPDC058789 TaxID=3346634 RepID=UPI00366E4C43
MRRSCSPGCPSCHGERGPSAPASDPVRSVRVHMVPRESILAGVTSPFQIDKLRDGSRVAASEHTDGTIVVNESPGVQRLRELARNALGSALPVDDTLRRLKEISDE